MKTESFENFIIKCCKETEWDLRSTLKDTLTEAGFSIVEDDYKSKRGGKYEGIHNMLAIRGDSPKTCLVAHTDVCRDYGWGGSTAEVNPTIKIEKRSDGTERKIIQDADCSVQVGGDDMLGVAINTWIALHTKYDMGLLFTTEEEVGAVSACHCSFKELMDFDILLQVDRGNYSDQLVVNIGGTPLCSKETGDMLIDVSKKLAMPRYKVNGLLTDVVALIENGVCKEAVNMTCGYFNSRGAQKDEYIDIEEALKTQKYVEGIIQRYEIGEEEFNKLFEPVITKDTQQNLET